MRKPAKKKAAAKKRRTPIAAVFEPTEAQRQRVRAMACGGLNHKHIASWVGCDPKTLRKHFREDLYHGKAWYLGELLETVLECGARRIDISAQQQACAMFTIKTQLKWSERLEHVGKNGGPIQHVDLSKLSDDELAQLERIREKTTAAGGDQGREDEAGG